MKKIFLFSVPTSICNFRCSYCYLAQRDSYYEGNMAQFQHSPEEFGHACSMERVGGVAYGNFTATGETLLTKNIDQYIKAFVEQGHYAEIVTNLTVTSMLEKILSWDKEVLKRIEFKCSFHYLELKKKGMLDLFASNVKKIWEAGASANIEITPADELIPYIEEVLEYSMEHFGALPHLTIARDDRTEGIGYLTELSMEEYEKIWQQFGSEFWEFKRRIFGKKQTAYCYAGMWSLYIDLANGEMRQCYKGDRLGNLFENLDKPLPAVPIGKCRQPHCFNGHMLLSAGLIPILVKKDDVRYGNLRNRIKVDGTSWLNEELLELFNSRVCEDNEELSSAKKIIYTINAKVKPRLSVGKVIVSKVKRRE